MATRICLFCKTPLPPEFHGSRKFCPDKNADGSFKKGDSICKTRLNNRKILARDEDLRAFVRYHKNAEMRLSRLHKTNEFVTDDDLRKVGVYTTIFIALNNDTNGSPILVYRKYALQPVENNKFKIIRYDHTKLFNLFS